MLEANTVEQVYDYICQYVTEDQTLPSCAMVAEALGLDERDVSDCVNCLRQQGRIASITLLPTVYAERWREYVRDHWSYKAMRLS